MARRYTELLPVEVTSVYRRSHINFSGDADKRKSEDKERSGTGAFDLVKA